MASVKGFGAKKAGAAAAGAEREGAEGFLNKNLQETLDVLKKQFEQDAKKIAAGEKPFFRSPEEAAAYWDKVYKELSTGVTKGIYPIGPNAPRITYKKDGQLFTLDRDVKPPAGAERVSLTDADILKIMPPRPQVTPKPAGEPNAYNNPPPPEYTARLQPSPAAQEAVQTAKETVAMPQVMRFQAPGTNAPPPPGQAGSAGPAGTYVPPGSRGPTVEAAREALAAPRSSVPNVDPRMRPNPPASGPWGAKAQTTAEPSNFAIYGGPAAIGAGAGAAIIDEGATPEGKPSLLRQAITSYTGGPDPYMTQREESPNMDNIPFMGPGVSSSPENFGSNNVADNPDFNPQMWNPPASSAQQYSGRENPAYYPEHVTPPPPEQSGRELGNGDPRFTGPGVSYDRSDFAPNGAISTAKQVISRAQNTPAAQARQAAAVLQQSPNQLTVQKAPEQAPSAFTRFIRGDFSEGADQRISEAMRRQKEESGVDSSTMARGGAAPKKSSKDDVLHKALEIIHHMLTRR